MATILVALSDAALARVTADLLARDGHVVLKGDAQSSIAIAGSYPGALDLLVVEVFLPQMSGVAVWNAVSPMRPEAKVLFTSGFERADEVLGDDAPLLRMPFTPALLRTAVQEALAQPPFITIGIDPEPLRKRSLLGRSKWWR